MSDGRNRIEIVRIEESAFARFREIRLRSLEGDPDAFGSTWAANRMNTDADWQAQLRTLPTYLAIRSGNDVGVVRGAPDDGDPRLAWLISLWVEPGMRGFGIGERLVDAVLGWAREARYERLLLDVADQNLPARALYARMGFHPTGETGSLPAPREHIREHRLAYELLAS